MYTGLFEYSMLVPHSQKLNPRYVPLKWASPKVSCLGKWLFHTRSCSFQKFGSHPWHSLYLMPQPIHYYILPILLPKCAGCVLNVFTSFSLYCYYSRPLWSIAWTQTNGPWTRFPVSSLVFLYSSIHTFTHVQNPH